MGTILHEGQVVKVDEQIGYVFNVHKGEKVFGYDIYH